MIEYIVIYLLIGVLFGLWNYKWASKGVLTKDVAMELFWFCIVLWPLYVVFFMIGFLGAFFKGDNE